MAKTLQVIALVSGGKDSMFCVLHCLANGHDIVALANLHPEAPPEAPEEIDSYMYQTVGHSVVPLYSRALGLPLYRQSIEGTAVDTAQAYSSTHTLGQPDETESLVPLLERVKNAHPEANAVCSGAILSTYQRTRIESVALRLSLIPLAYLWQYPLLPTPHPASLLFDMEAAGMDARLVKVASGGLDESHLWMNVANKKTIARLQRDMSLFGEPGLGSVLGEGGEFETLAIDGPSPLWKQRIEVEYSFIRADGGVAFVRTSNALLREKHDANERTIRVPELWDALSTYLLARDNPVLKSTPEAMVEARSLAWLGLRSATMDNEDDIHISNVLSSLSGSVEDELESIASELSRQLTSCRATTDDIILATIILRSMVDFAPLNSAYGKLFRRPNPPARVTIAVGDVLPRGRRLSLSVIASKKPQENRQGLHVQSQSYWAPANIGPYSQAISYALPVCGTFREPSKLVHIAGQIPLVPASMELHSGSFIEQAVLSLQHLWRIGRATKVHCWTDAVAFLDASMADEGAERAAVCVALWRQAHEAASEQTSNKAEAEAEDFDVGNMQLRQPWARRVQAISDETQGLLASIPDTTRLAHTAGPDTSTTTPSCLVAEVSELPRASPVEWVSQGLSLGQHEDGQNVQALVLGNEQRKTCTDASSAVSFSCACFPLRPEPTSELVNTEIPARGAKLLHCEAYVTGHIAGHDKAWLEEIKAQIIPCRRLWNGSGPLTFAVRWREQAI